MELTEARVTPVHRPGPVGFVGVIPAEPRRYRGLDRGAWEASRDAAQAVIAPRARDDRELLAVVALEDEETSGRTGLLVKYHDADASYEWHDRMTYEVRVGSSCRK